MSIRIKIAQDALELNDVFRLRHQVYVEQEGVFKSTGSDAMAIVDCFDAFPPAANIIAYSGSEPIGTLRMNLDTGAGLPSEELYNFDTYRQQVTEEWREKHGESPCFMSGGLLAISYEWRNRRDVLRALLKMGAGIGHSWSATHVIATPSVKSYTLYKRLGFERIDEDQLIESIGDSIVPMVAKFEDYYSWAFGDLTKNKKFLDIFADRFQWLILGSGETLFKEGDEGQDAYIIDNGTVRILRRVEETGEEPTLAILGQGDLFGELSLIDAKPRSARAMALTNTELIKLDRDDFLSRLKEQPGYMQDMLEHCAARIRRADELIAALHGSATPRMDHALEDIRSSATPDAKRPDTLLAKIGVVEFASNAGVGEQEARDYLEEQKALQKIEFTDRRIRFLHVENV